MNDRIQELAEQSGCYQPHGLPSDWDNNDYVVSPDHMKKFAELIVKECICLALSAKYDSDKYDPDAEFHCGHNIALDGIAEGLKEHFGVKV